MQENFENLIASFIENKVGIYDHFLSDALSNNLTSNLQDLHKQKLLLAAATGNANKLHHDTAVRSDSIYWLDKKHDDKYEDEFFLQMEGFIKYLNMSCYTGITNYEFHYSLYESGSFYKKHIDQFQDNSDRKYSMISYLNNNWQKESGGELLIHQENKDQKISPTQGKTVFFKSNELEHEVLVTHQTRMSVTGWLKSDKNNL